MASTTSRNYFVDRWSSIIVGFSLLLILASTLFSYDFLFKETAIRLNHHFLFLGWGKSNLKDVIKNVLLFAPMGYGLTCLMQKRRQVGLATLTVVFLVSLGLSYTVEVLQIFLPSRSTSFFDVLSNSAGGLLGFFCFHIWGLWGYKAFVYTSNFLKESIGNLMLSFLGYATILFLASIPLQQASNLSNWDKAFPLLLGNERTGDRPWQGHISEIYITNRALLEAEVERAFSEKRSIALIGDSLLVSYQLRGIGNYHDKLGNLPDLVWRGEQRDVQHGKGALLGPNHWLETATPATYLTQRIIETSQFALGVTVATNDTTQTGPARIISLSGDTHHRNFTLGQEGSDLVFWFRTPLTGESGTKPQLIVPDIFSTTNPRNVVITYDGSILSLYVDEVRNCYTLELTPGTATPFRYLFPLNAFNMIIYKGLYYAFVFVPLGILLVPVVKRMKRRLSIQIPLIIGSILFPSFILEGILVAVSGKVVRLENLLFSVMFTVAPMVLFKLYRTQIVTDIRR